MYLVYFIMTLNMKLAAGYCYPLHYCSDSCKDVSSKMLPLVVESVHDVCCLICMRSYISKKQILCRGRVKGGRKREKDRICVCVRSRM